MASVSLFTFYVAVASEAEVREETEALEANPEISQQVQAILKRASTSKSHLYSDLSKEDRMELQRLAPQIRALNLGATLFPQRLDSHAQVLFPNLRFLAGEFPNLQVLTLRKGVWYGVRELDGITKEEILACFPQRQKKLYVHYTDECAGSTFSERDRAEINALRALAKADPKAKDNHVDETAASPIAEEKQVVALQVQRAVSPVFEAKTTEPLIVALKPAQAAKIEAKVEEVVAQISIPQEVKIEKSAPKKKRVITHKTKFPVGMQKPHILLFALSYLMPKNSPSLYFKQNCAREYKDVTPILFVSRELTRFRQLFIKTVLEIGPQVTIFPPRSYAHLFAVKAKGDLEKAFLSEIATRVHPNAIKTLDLRKLRVDPANPCSWAEKICDKYPNIEQLHLPFGAVLNAELGKLLAMRLKSLRRLDISYADKRNLEGLAKLTELTGLYNQVPIEYADMEWASPDRASEINEKFQLVAPSPEEVANVKDMFALDARCVKIISNLTNLVDLFLGFSDKLDDKAMRPLSKLEKLRVLSMFLPKITHETVKTFSSSRDSLRSLTILNCSSLDNSAFALIAQQFEHLQEFVFGENGITDDAFDSLQSMRHLESLMIDRCDRVTGSHFGKLFLNRGLRRLVFLENQPVLDEDILFLHTISGLQLVHIKHGTAISEQNEAAFRQQRPTCELYIDRPEPDEQAAPPPAATVPPPAEENAANQAANQATSQAVLPAVVTQGDGVNGLIEQMSALSVASPEEVQELDLRKETFHQRDPYAWAEQISLRYPNVRMLHLPLGLRLDDRLGQILARLQSLRTLDISYCDKSDLSGLRHLRIETLYNEPKFGATKSQWLPPEQEVIELGSQLSKAPENVSGAQIILRHEGLQAIARVPTLRSLHLGLVHGVDDEAMRALAALTNLEELHMALPNITDKGITHLAPLVRLHTLDVRGCARLDDRALVWIRMQWPHLRELHISGASFTNKAFKILSGCSELTSLLIGRSDGITEEAFRDLQECASLKRVVVALTQPVNDTIFTHLQRIPALEFLKIYDGKRISDGAMDAFQASKPERLVAYIMTQIVDEALAPEKSHEMRRADLRDVKDSHLPARLQQHRDATFIQLPFCTLSRDLRDHLLRCSDLQALDIAYLAKNDDLAHLSDLTRVRKIFCRSPYEFYNSFFQTTEETQREDSHLLATKLSGGLGNVMRSLSNESVQLISAMEQLEVFDLGHSDAITDEALELIARLKQLKELYFFGAPITQAGIEKLRPLTELHALSILGCRDLNSRAFRLIINQFPKLRTLYCGRNSGVTSSVHRFGEFTSLETLLLADDTLSTREYQSLTSITTLKSLYVLKSKQLTEEVILSFASLRHLRMLHIGNCTSVSATAGQRNVGGYEISEAVVSELQRRMPHCQIIISDCSKNSRGVA